MQDEGESPESWEFAGWGVASKIDDLTLRDEGETHGHRLGEWASTAICGNDITSSCLYVSALCAAQAGIYAPLVLGLVAVILYFFRAVYAEVGSALPLNGGTYTLLLNSTNKRIAAAAAVLTLLSYVATAVISAGEASHYAHNLWSGLPVFGATLALLGLFALLNVIGISESAVVALGIFVFHIVTLITLTIACCWAISMDPQTLFDNFAVPSRRSFMSALFFGFAAAMLGISGFESSANFIEEQEKGVFPKTLRNMWVAVAVFNPLIALLALGMLPLADIQEVPPDLLAQMGLLSWGKVLRTWVSIDAVLVLSGAVLTSYVGVTGLVRRMALDNVLPQILLEKNRWRDTNHWIILGFFFVCCSIMVVTGGDVETLAGVYTISFLSVMALFAIGNMLLKSVRSRLPRETEASWPVVVVALAAVLLGLAGNVLLDPHYVQVFGGYFIVAGTIVAVMFLRIQLLRVLMFVVGSVADTFNRINSAVREEVRRVIEGINSQAVVYFTKGDDPAELNRAALYVLENEQTNRMIVVHAYDSEDRIPAGLAHHLSEIDRLYPHLRIDFMAVHGEFGPGLIGALSDRLGVPRNFMFIGTPGDRFPHRIEHLGGVRLIL